MKKIKATEPNCLTELTNLKQKAVIYHQDTIDRLIEENIKIKEMYELLENELYNLKCSRAFRTQERYKQALEKIREKCKLYIDDKADLTPEQVIDIIDEVLNLK